VRKKKRGRRRTEALNLRRTQFRELGGKKRKRDRRRGLIGALRGGVRVWRLVGAVAEKKKKEKGEKENGQHLNPAL